MIEILWEITNLNIESNKYTAEWKREEIVKSQLKSTQNHKEHMNLCFKKRKTKNMNLFFSNKKS